MDTQPSRRVIRFNLSDYGTQLTSRRLGVDAAEHLRRLAEGPVDIVIYFTDVELVSASFLIALLTNVRQLVSDKKDDSPLVVVTNLTEDVLEELEFVLEHKKFPLAILRDDQVDVLQAPEHLQETLRSAREFPERFTAPKLAERLDVQPTAMNQRLAPLVESGVVARKSNRTKRGQPALYIAVKPELFSTRPSTD